MKSRHRRHGLSKEKSVLERNETKEILMLNREMTNYNSKQEKKNKYATDGKSTKTCEKSEKPYFIHSLIHSFICSA